jgi:DNA-binding NarL/FixJ family response regulator
VLLIFVVVGEQHAAPHLGKNDPVKRADVLLHFLIAHIQLPPQKDLLMGRVIALMDDLFFQMKLAETAKHLGIEVKVATNAEAFQTLLDPLPKLAVIDLNARSNPLQVVQQLRQSHPDLRVVAFLSHVQRDLAAQAQAAGCTEVMPRSAFTQNLAAILADAKD